MRSCNPPQMRVRMHTTSTGGGDVRHRPRRSSCRHPMDKGDAHMQTNDVLDTVPTTQPVEIAPETFLIPNLFPAGDGLFVPVNSMVIRGAEPVIVDTGAPVHRELWLE